MKKAGRTDEVLSVLNDSRRRQVLYCLLSNDCTDRDSLALQIAAWERDESIASVETAAVESVKVSLHHNHLPKLVESGLIQYDSRAGDVVRDGRFDDIEFLVDELRTTEEAVSRDDSTGPTTDDEERPPFLSP